MDGVEADEHPKRVIELEKQREKVRRMQEEREDRKRKIDEGGK